MKSLLLAALTTGGFGVLRGGLGALTGWICWVVAAKNDGMMEARDLWSS